MYSITSIEELRKIRRNKNGFVVITDYPNKTQRIHIPSCPHVDERNFERKVLENDGTNGRYFWVEDIVTARQNFEVLHWCSVCKRRADV